jgi:hypothetical protein
MNPNPQRNSNPAVCFTLIALGVLCFLVTIFAAVYLKNGIIERVRETPSIEGIGDVAQIGSIERQIQSKDRDIELAGKMPDMDKSLQEARKKLGLKPAANSADSTFEQDKADKIKKLEEEKKQLIVKKDELAGKNRARQMRTRSWGEWAEDNGIELFLGGVLPLGLFSLFLMPFVFGGKLPARNPLSLTDFERRCVLFLPFALVFSAFGFFLFVWILSLIY